MENVDDLEKEMNTNAEIASIDKKIENLTGQWNNVKTNRFLMYYAELGDGRVHTIQVHTSHEDVIAVCAHALREVIEKTPEKLRPVMTVSIISTITNELK